MTDVRPVRLLLIGMMGAGKSTIGKMLAEALRWEYVDNDDLLRASTGLATSTLLDERGEHALRDAESQVLHELLHRAPPFVGGVAAGVVTRPKDRDALADSDAFIVWLRARPVTLVRNVGSGEGRPWLQPDPASALRMLALGRAPLYAEVADLTVDVDGTAPEDIAHEILAALAR